VTRALRGCTGKVRFFSRREARHARRLMHVSRRVHLQAYLCAHCACWHLGSVPRSVLRGLIAKTDLLWQ
jgi:hypothetical protein